MGSISIIHWVMVLAVILLVFGTKKLSNAGSDLGSAIRNFKDCLKGDNQIDKKQAPKD